VLAFLAVLGVALPLAPYPRQRIAVPQEWAERAGVDYPGFKAVSFNTITSRTSSGLGEAEWRLVLVPPGQSVEVGVIYKSSGGQPPTPQEDVLRPAGRFHDKAPSLLDLLESGYMRERRAVSVSNDAAGVVTIDWVELTWLGRRRHGTDTLVFDGAGGSWRVTEHSTELRKENPIALGQ
jgi:hypothetical protein